MLLLILLAGIWLFQGNTPQINISWATAFPSLHFGSSWVSLTAIMASFLGIELAGVHVADIKNPQSNFPKALGYSSTFLVLTMLFRQSLSESRTGVLVIFPVGVTLYE